MRGLEKPILSVIVVASLLSCGTVGTPEPHAEDRVRAFMAAKFELEPDSPFLVIVPAEFSLLSATAFQVEIQDQVPAYQVLLVDSARGLTPSLINKSLVQEWKKVISTVLSDVIASRVDPVELASDLAKLVVDPNPSYGRVISAETDIPVDMESSARYQFLKRRGLSTLEIRTHLLENLPPEAKLHSPSFSTDGERVFLTFYSWNYFGGEVIKWKIFMADPRHHTTLEEIAKEVGSYDFYM